MDNAQRTHHSITTKGGAVGHWWRRLIHLSIALLPILYYKWGEVAAGFFHLSPIQLVLVILLINVVLESGRLYFGLILWGHRERERKQISSLAWGILSIGLVLILAPGPLFAVPIIWSCAIADPILGELRRYSQPTWLVESVGVVVVLLIWWVSTLWLGTPWWYAVIMSPLIVAAEYPNLKWIDDNALMQLVPLLFVLLFNLLF